MEKLNLKFAVIATEKWPTRETKHKNIEKLMTRSKSIESVIFDTIHVENIGEPEIYIDSNGNKKITEKWFEENISSKVKSQNYDGAIFSYSNAEGKKWGITSGVRGSAYNDKDGFMEMWVKSDEKDFSTFKTVPKKRDKYTKVVPHEIGHNLKYAGLTKLLIHDYDYSLSPEINKIEKFYDEFEIDPTLDKERRLSLMQRAGGLLQILLGLKKAEVPERGLEQFPEHLRPLVKQKQDKLIEVCASIGINLKVTSEVRTCAQQNELYSQGRTKPGNIVTNAKCGQSMHNYGIAFDVAFSGLTPYEGPWELVGMIGEQIGLEWGGRWTAIVDKPHFEITFGYSLSDFENNKIDWSRYNV